jgi:hypothetical protein
VLRAAHTHICKDRRKGRSIVTMVQPADSLLRKDPTRSCGTSPAVRCSLLKPEMRAVLVMVTNILGEQSLQMAFIQRNNVVHPVPSTASHPPLRDAILRIAPSKMSYKRECQEKYFSPGPGAGTLFVSAFSPQLLMREVRR